VVKTPFLCTVYPDIGRIVVHDMGEREPDPDEVEAVRDALPAPAISVWWAVLSIVLGVGALVWLGHGIGKGIGS